MIVLDTNVLSALMRDAPDAEVVRWLDQQAADVIWTTSITVFEVRFGLQTLPLSKRRRALEAAFERVLVEDLEQRVLDFDAAAADAAGILAAARQKRGRPVDLRDTQIAGILLSRRGTLATRNVRHFADLKVPIVNPWDVLGKDGR